MASFTRSTDSVKGLLSDASECPTVTKPLDKKRSALGDDQKAGKTMESLVHGEENADTVAGDAGQRKHYVETLASTASEVGHLSEESQFKPSIKVIPQHPKDTGFDLIAQEMTPTDLSDTRPPGKRIFEQKQDSVCIAEAAVEPPSKKPKGELSGVASAMATDVTGPIEEQTHHKKIIEAANKADRVGESEAAAEDEDTRGARRHFEAKRDTVTGLLLQPEDTGEAPVKRKAPLVEASNVPVVPAGPTAGMKSAEINRPMTAPSTHATENAAENKTAGVSSADLNEQPSAAGTKNARTAVSARAAMSGSSMSSCLQWE